MKKPKDEAARISVAMGYCPECQAITTFRQQIAALHLDVPSPRCHSDGHEYECNKDKRNGHARAASGRV